MASSTGPRRRRGAPEPRTFEGPETGRPRDAGSPEQELRAERARRPPPTHAQCREEMYQARPLSRNLFLYTFLQNHGPGFLDDQGEGLPGVTNILEFHPVSPYSDGPHYLAMQLASIADEMELRLLLPQFVEPIRMTVYSHIGLRDVLRSFMVAFTNLRENRSLWSFLTLRDRVSPSPWPELALSLLLVVTLSWGRRLH
ncbi:bcl-2-interacting killer isoform X4 [Phocoena sinus]|nr:bcl-2-interacting killer isoform X4 [Phocoena sinus]